MLYTVGFVNDWYTYCKSSRVDGIDIFIDINSSGSQSYKKDPKKMVHIMKERLRDYFDVMGNNRESIAKTNRASTPEEIIRVYVSWYYDKYLYHHNEQFLDLYEFVLNNTNAEKDIITSSIKDYFTLPFIKLKSDEAAYNEMALKEIADKAQSGFTRLNIANVERINSNRYSYRLDYLLFCANIQQDGNFEQGRLDRVLSFALADERKSIGKSLRKFYKSCNIDSRIAILNYIEKNCDSLSIDMQSFLESAYSDGKKDLIFYGLMAKKANIIFNSYRRRNRV